MEKHSFNDKAYVGIYEDPLNLLKYKATLTNWKNILLQVQML